jgi:hypothetical protein
VVWKRREHAGIGIGEHGDAGKREFDEKKGGYMTTSGKNVIKNEFFVSNFLGKKKKVCGKFCKLK